MNNSEKNPNIGPLFSSSENPAGHSNTSADAEGVSIPFPHSPATEDEQKLYEYLIRTNTAAHLLEGAGAALPVMPTEEETQEAFRLSRELPRRRARLARLYQERERINAKYAEFNDFQ